MKKFIIAVIILLAIVFVFRWIMESSYNNQGNYGNGGYNSAPAYHESIGNGIVHSAVKGVVEGYVAGKVINHGMRRAQERSYHNYSHGYSHGYSHHGGHGGHR